MSEDNNTFLIPLGGEAAQRGLMVEVSPEDYDFLKSQGVWYENKNARGGPRYIINYQASRNDKGKRVTKHALMHQLVAQRAGITGEVVGYKDGNHLNNRRDNLIGQTRAEARARGRIQNNKRANPYKGVMETPEGTFTASIYPEGRTIRLGTYPTPELAAAAYNGAAIALFGPNATLNPVFSRKRKNAPEDNED